MARNIKDYVVNEVLTQINYRDQEISRLKEILEEWIKVLPQDEPYYPCEKCRCLVKMVDALDDLYLCRICQKIWCGDCFLGMHIKDQDDECQERLCAIDYDDLNGVESICDECLMLMKSKLDFLPFRDCKCVQSRYKKLKN